MFMVKMNAYLTKAGRCTDVKNISRGRIQMLQKLNDIILFIYFATTTTHYEKCLRCLYKTEEGCRTRQCFTVLSNTIFNQ